MDWKIQIMEIKVDDKVIKARRYSKDAYCKYGGTKEDVPIGAIGIVTKIRRNCITCNFTKYRYYWSLDISELDLV